MDALMTLIPVVLTLMVFSRILGDTVAFRVAQYLFVGVALGYAFVVIYHQVLRPAVIDLLAASGQPALLSVRFVPFALAALLLTRVSGQQASSWLANLPLALVFGVGAALVIGGALIGTILPQVLDTTRQDLSSPATVLGGVTLLIGTILVLLSFARTQSLNPAQQRRRELAVQAGRWILLVAFGFFLAGSITSYLTALNERLIFIVDWVQRLLGV